MDCRFCGEPAGFLKRHHPECAERHEGAVLRATGIVGDAACGGRTWPEIESAVREAMREGRVAADRLQEIVLRGVEEGVERVLDDDILDEDEEKSMAGFLRSYLDAGFPGAKLDPITDRLVKAAVIRMVLEGRNPAPQQPDADFAGFRFMKSEAPIWSFDHVSYITSKTRVRYTGGSRGVSFRVAKGVYMRTGGFRGERITEEERTHADEGQLVITTKHLYFKGDRHRFRVRHDRVVSYEPLEDGFELTRDRANARPEGFLTGDGWFAYHLLVNAEELT